MLLYASSITNLTDARYFAAREVDFLGFNLEAGTPGYLDPIYMKAMREWVQGPRIAGEFSRSDVQVVREAALFYGLDAVLLRGESYAETLPTLEGLTVLLEAETTAGPDAVAELFRRSQPWVEYFILHFAERPAEPAAWREVFSHYPVLLQWDGPAAGLPDFLAALQPAGLLLRGGAEEQVGVKSFEEIEAVFDLLER